MVSVGPQAAAAAAADPRIEKYSLMFKMNMPESVIRRKMALNGLSELGIEEFFKKYGEPQPPPPPSHLSVRPSSPAAAAVTTGVVSVEPNVADPRIAKYSPQAAAAAAAADPRIAKYSLMFKMNLPESAIRQKMAKDGLSELSIEEFFKRYSEPQPPPPPSHLSVRPSSPAAPQKITNIDDIDS